MGDEEIVINLANTHYEVIKHVVEEDMEWKISTDANDENFDIWWSDLPISDEKFAELQQW